MALLIPGLGLVDATGTLLLPGAGIVEFPAADVTVAPSVGTLRLVGQTPTVTAEQAWTITPTAGALVFAGQQPTISSGWPFDQALYPTAVTLTNLTGAATDIDDDPSTPDGNWLLAA